MSEKATRNLYTPQPVQARVIESHMQGVSNREIAREEGLDRETVSRILSQRELVEALAENQSRLLRLAAKALTVYEKLLDSEDSHVAAATATKILEGSGVMDKRGLQGTIDDSITREELHHTRMLPEFGQGPYEFKRRKPRRMPVRTELQVVPHPLIEGGSDTETETQLEAVTQKQIPGAKDAQPMPSLFEDETNGKS